MSLHRILKMAELLEGTQEFDNFVVYVESYINKYSHLVPSNDGTTPNPWRRNMDYSEYDCSPYYGNVNEFLKKFPGGIKQWLEWRRKNQKSRFQRYSENKQKDKK